MFDKPTYGELLKRKKVKTKLRKYDKIIQRNIKRDVEVSTGIRIPIIDSGIKTGTREYLKQILYA